MPHDKRPQTAGHNAAISAGVLRAREKRFGPSAPPQLTTRRQPKGAIRCGPCVRGDCRSCMVGTEITGAGMCRCEHIEIGIAAHQVARSRIRARSYIDAARERGYVPATDGVQTGDTMSRSRDGYRKGSRG